MARFIETFCRQSRGKAAGQPVKLRPWQRGLLNEMFTLRDDGKRKHQTGLLGLPRKNGKSTLGSGIALYLLVADGEAGAEVYSCAGDKKQARIVFAEAKKMVLADPDLSATLRVYADAIEHPGSQGVYRVLSADAALQQGLNPSACIFDEVHVQPNSELWDALALGMGTREQPLMLGITTAGYDEESLLYRLYEYGRRVQSGEVDDPTFWFKWWEPADRECDWLDPAVWKEANPALGDFLHEERLAADSRTTLENEFRRYHLNQWTRAANAWLPFGAWERCKEPALGLDPELPVCVGIDLALRHDSIAVVCAQRQTVGEEFAPHPMELPKRGEAPGAATDTAPDGLVAYDADPDDAAFQRTPPSHFSAPPPRILVNTPPPSEKEAEKSTRRLERTVMRARIWENPFAENDPRHGLWQLDVFEVEEWLRSLFKAFPVPAAEIDGVVKPGPAFLYDPSYFGRSATVLAADQLAMVEVPQSDARMIPASQAFYKLVTAGEIAHDGDPAFARQIANAAADQKPRGWRLTKPKGSRKKIDAAVAGAIAAHRAQADPPQRQRSVYESRGIRTL